MSMQLPLISIIVPIYNVSLYLQRSLDSILRQTYTNLEIILVDDGSQDDSGLICDQYRQKDYRIKVCHQTNAGVAEARNTGLQHASGEYIGFVDPDDYVDDGYFMDLFQAMVSSGADVSACSYYSFGGENKRHAILSDNTYTQKKAMFALIQNDEMPSYLWNKLFKKELFSGISFPTGYRYEDVRIMHKIFQRIHSLVTINNYHYHYLVREDSITGSTRLVKSNELIESYESRRQDLAGTIFYNKAVESELVLIRRICMDVYQDDSASASNYAAKMVKRAKEIYMQSARNLSFREKMKSGLFVRFPNFYYKYLYKKNKF